MKQYKSLFNFFIWWAVIGYSIWVGGTIFSMSVIVPMWDESPPQSVIAFVTGTKFDKYIYNFFGPPWMVIRNLPLFIALVLGWNCQLHRRYLLIASACIIIGVVFTLAYIYPINANLFFSKDIASQSAGEIQSMASKWVIADRVRFAEMLVGYFFLLKAFRLPMPDKKD